MPELSSIEGKLNPVQADLSGDGLLQAVQNAVGKMKVDIYIKTCGCRNECKTSRSRRKNQTQVLCKQIYFIFLPVQQPTHPRLTVRLHQFGPRFYRRKFNIIHSLHARFRFIQHLYPYYQDLQALALESFCAFPSLRRRNPRTSVKLWVTRLS